MFSNAPAAFSVGSLLWLVGFGFLVLWLLSGVTVVRGRTAAIVEMFGKPLTEAKLAGLRYVLPWPFQTVVGRLDLRQQEIRKEIEVKTQDDAFVKLPVAIQLHIAEDASLAVQAHYKFSNPMQQITSYVLNVVRQAASGMTLAQLYETRDRIAKEVENELLERLGKFGYKIDTVLVDQPTPSEEIQHAFNRVLAANRLKQAAEQEAEAEKIRRVGIARAEAESKRLQGVGLAQQRIEYAKGLKESMETFKGALPGVSEELLIGVMMMTNHLDTVATASGNKATTILLNSSATGAMDEMSNMMAALKAFQAANADAKADAQPAV